MTTLLVMAAVYASALLLLTVMHFAFYRGHVKLLYKLMDIVEEIRKRIE